MKKIVLMIIVSMFVVVFATNYNNEIKAEEKPRIESFESFINFIKLLENDANVGFVNGKWYPHQSYEGGMPTIAWGHKIKSKKELEKMKNGISNEDAENLLIDDLRYAKKRVIDYIGNVNLNNKQQEMLTEFAFNLGGLSKFPKFTKAVLDKNWEKAKKECKRYSDGKPLVRRNQLFSERYFEK